jgi:hypothetical protein
MRQLSAAGCTGLALLIVGLALAGGADADSQPAEAARAFQLPDHRAYELVSPPDKNNNDIDAGLAIVGIGSVLAWNGNAVGYCSGSIFGEVPNVFNQLCGYGVSTRTASGWGNAGVVPVFCPVNHDDTSSTSTGATVRGFSRDLEFAAFGHPEGGSCPDPVLDPLAPTPATNLYRSDLRAEAPGFSLLTPQFPYSPSYSASSGIVAGGSDDFSHVVLGSTGRQTTDAPEGNFEKVFDWHEGQLSLVSRDPAGAPFLTKSAVVANANAYGGISSSGNRIAFQNPVPEVSTPASGAPFGCPSNNCEIYLRIDGSRTVDVSESECTSSCGARAGAFFLRGTPDGSKLWFESEAKLVNGDESSSGLDLYMYSDSPDPAAEPNLTLLSRDGEPADGTGAEVQQVLGTSEDGSVVFFVAKGQIVPGASIAPGYKIYRWRWNGGSPVVEYLTTLPLGGGGGEDPSAGLNWFRAKPNAKLGAASLETAMDRLVSPDGKYLLLQTERQLDPAADQDGDVDQYRWDEEDGFVCVTCQIPGRVSQGASYVSPPTPPTSLIARPSNITMSDDGSRVFFQSRDALVADDQNGNVQDVYEWEDGDISLVSSGDSNRDAYLLGASRSGDDVFFVTDSPLVGWDTDSFRDIYDARVGGGFPEPPEVAPPCEGDACRQFASAASTSISPTSASLVRPREPHSTRKQRNRRKHHRGLRIAVGERRAVR